jgi:hypothetical protein
MNASREKHLPWRLSRWGKEIRTDPCYETYLDGVTNGLAARWDEESAHCIIKYASLCYQSISSGSPSFSRRCSKNYDGISLLLPLEDRRWMAMHEWLILSVPRFLPSNALIQFVCCQTSSYVFETGAPRLSLLRYRYLPYGLSCLPMLSLLSSWDSSQRPGNRTQLMDVLSWRRNDTKPDCWSYECLQSWRIF